MLCTTLPNDLCLWCRLSQYFLIKDHFDRPANLHKAPTYSCHKKSNQRVQVAFQKKMLSCQSCFFRQKEVHVCTFICSKQQAQILDTSWIERRCAWDGVAHIYVTKIPQLAVFNLFLLLLFFPSLFHFAIAELYIPINGELLLCGSSSEHAFHQIKARRTEHTEKHASSKRKGY